MSVFFGSSLKPFVMGVCPYLVRVEADILTRAVSQRFWGDRSARRTELMSTLESQSEDVNTEVLDAGLANWDEYLKGFSRELCVATNGAHSWISSGGQRDAEF